MCRPYVGTSLDVTAAQAYGLGQRGARGLQFLPACRKTGVLEDVRTPPHLAGYWAKARHSNS